MSFLKKAQTRNMLRQWAESFLTLFIIAIFCLSALQVVLLTREEVQSVSDQYKQEDTGRNNRMLLVRAGTDLERVLLNYYLGRHTVTKQDITKFKDYFYSFLDAVLQPEVQTDELKDLRLHVISGVEKMETYLDEPVPLDVDKISAFSSDLMLWQDNFRELRQYLIKNTLDGRESNGLSTKEFLVLSIGSMAISGLGLIILLLLKLRISDRLLRERQKLSNLLEPRIAAIETAMDGVCITDQRGMLRYVNKALTAYHGFDAPELLVGRHWHTLYDEDQQEWFINEVIPIVEREGRWRGHCKGLRLDGTTFHEDVVIVAMDDGGYVFVVRDYTELLESIMTSNRRLAAIEAAGDGIGIVDSNGNLVYANEALWEIHGLHSEDMDQYINKHWSNIYTEKGRNDIRENVMPVLMKSGYWKGESPLVKKNGDIINAELTLTLLPDGGFVGTARDISDRKKAEAERENLQKQFFQAQKMEALGRMAGGIAHDFNNILSSIIGYAEFLIEDLGEGSPQQGFARQIFKGGDQARKLVDQILAFSRRSDVGMTILDLNSTVHDCHEMLKPGLAANFKLEIVTDGLEKSVRANPTQVSQALMNLAVNALDAMEETHGGILRIEIGEVFADEESVPVEMLVDKLSKAEHEGAARIVEKGNELTMMSGVLERGGNYVFLRVTDIGSGMSREVMEHIFEPFFTTKAVDRGTGLGLAAVHGIVTGHRGGILVRSVIGKGTVFTLFFPQSSDLVEARAVAQQPDQADGGRILVVDDQPDVAAIAVEMLCRLGYEADSVNNGDAAIDLLREKPGHYNLVLSDYSMPEMTGVDLAAQVVEDFPGLPVVVMIGHGRKTLESALKKNPAVAGMMRKPLDCNSMAQIISRALKKAA